MSRKPPSCGGENDKISDLRGQKQSCDFKIVSLYDIPHDFILAFHHGLR